MPTHDEIEKEAYQIYQRRKQAGDPNYTDSFANWMRAQTILIEKDRFNYEKWTRGCCGE